MRLWLVVLGLAVALAVPFLVWGEHFDEWFSPQRIQDLFRSWGSWAWLVGIALMCADIVLPMPATVVMAALGTVYGTVLGGLVAAAGSFVAGVLAYGFCRLLGRAAARRIVGVEELRRGEELFGRVGAWAVALSRWMPLLPEVIACLAGLVKMPAGRFCAALACGCVPLGFTFAWVGDQLGERPRLTLLLSALLPALLWVLVGRALAVLSRRRGEVDADTDA